MAIYHFSGTVISRSQGRSAVACAAYRSAELLQDLRYGKMHDYTQKQDVAHKEILLPEGAPSFLKDRETLWNTVEAIEKRKDAQLAREFNFALPKELTLEQNIALAREFVQREFVDKGMVADLCIHNDKTPDGEPQPHAHVMLTLRQVTKDGFGQKVREWNAKENLLQWRGAWAEVANRHLFLHDYDLRIDHRTLVEQGIDLEPQHKIGAAIVQERMARFEDHQRIARENGEKLFAQPEIVLDAITRQQSTFTHQDLARFVNRHTVDAEQFQLVYDKVKTCEHIVSLGRDGQGRERFSTHELLTLETQMLNNAYELAKREGHGVRTVIRDRVLKTYSLTDEQKMAFDYVTQTGDVKCIVGYAGTGKSYLLGAAREAWEAQGYRVHGMALSGIAAQNLQHSSGIESRTLASYFYHWDKGQRPLTSNDIVVVDEAGMVSSRQMARLVAEAERARAKLVPVGDPRQLQAIEAGAPHRALCQAIGYVELTEIRRQREPWQREATKEFALGKTEIALHRYDQHHHVHHFETQAVAKQTMLSHWNDVRLTQPDKTQIMLTYTRQDVQELNERARGLRKARGELGEDHAIATTRGERPMAVGDRIYFLQRDDSLGVVNGSLGTVCRIDEQTLHVQLDVDRFGKVPTQTVAVDTHLYRDLDHGYAATIYKAQGITVDRTYVLASRYLDSHGTYVAMSRHRDSSDLFWSREEFTNERALTQALSRDRAKDLTLDYTRSSALSMTDERLKVIDQTHQHQESPAHDVFPEKKREQLREMGEQEKGRAQSFETLEAFKARYEQKYPGLAKQHQEMTLPTSEKKMHLAIEHFKELQQALEKNNKLMLKNELGKHAEKMAKEPKMMDYLLHTDRDMYDRVRALVRERELARERTRGHGRSL